MNLEELKQRKNEVQQALVNTQQSLLILQGHLQELDFLVTNLEKKEAEEKVDAPVEHE